MRLFAQVVVVVMSLAELVAGCAASSGPSEGPISGDGQAPITVMRVSAVSIGRVDAELTPRVTERAVVCAPLVERARTELCVFPSRTTLVSSLGRAALGIEKLRGNVLDHESLAKLANGSAIGGVDFESSALAAFRDTQMRASLVLGPPKSDAARRVVATESAFWESYVVPVVVPDPERVLLGVPRAEDGGLDAQVLDHEYLHAQFFEDAALEVAVGQCFDALPEVRKAAVTETLRAAAVYDTANPRLVRNEYLAYTLTDGFDGVTDLEGARGELESCLTRARVSVAHATK